MEWREGLLRRSEHSFKQSMCGLPNMFKDCQTLGMFCDGMTKNVLLCQRNAVRVEWDQFHPQVVGAMESSATESFMHQVSCHIFIFLSNFNVDCLDKLAFGLGEGVSRVGRGIGREGRGLGFLVPS